MFLYDQVAAAVASARYLSGRDMDDLAAQAFLTLRSAFYDAEAVPQSFRLRDKRNTQDDPLDEYVHRSLAKALSRQVDCERAPGPLVSPDLVLLRRKSCREAHRESLVDDPTRIIALEVKKLERQPSGAVARASGMDYNTTPPCGTVRIYDRGGAPLDIRGFYLFVCQEPSEDKKRQYNLSALALCDGNVLNADFGYYLSIIGSREKEIGIGTYGNGMNRVRPMLIFANPLGAAELDHNVTLVHSNGDLASQFPELQHAGVIRRSVKDGPSRMFHCYRQCEDIPSDHEAFDVTDPFPTPTQRTTATQARGQFRLDLQFPE